MSLSDHSEGQSAGPAARPVTDPRELRALAHPRRIELLELLAAHGPMTASQCAEKVGDSPASCSYHLRQLARFGHVEEAPGGRGRERPWRMRRLAITFGGSGGGVAEQTAAQALAAVVDSTRFAAAARYRERHGVESPEWQDAALSTDALSWMTDEELADVGRRVVALWAPYVERWLVRGERPAGSRPVQLFAYGFPVGPESEQTHQPESSEEDR
ncbi:MAG TPA: helix-turn-helix domain-containing protein [Motilibacteraceae bacterium]|nr:helix-turn-helix domain-containing protein [Motilibacteraceae bacterium]